MCTLKQNLSIRVPNAAGQLVESKANVPVQGILELGHIAGMYFVEEMQGQQQITFKLLKSQQ